MVHTAFFFAQKNYKIIQQHLYRLELLKYNDNDDAAECNSAEKRKDGESDAT